MVSVEEGSVVDLFAGLKTKNPVAIAKTITVSEINQSCQCFNF